MRLDEHFFLVSSGPKSLYFSLGKLIFPVTGFSTFVYLKVKLRSNNGSPERAILGHTRKYFEIFELFD